MKIAVDTRHLQSEHFRQEEYFLYATLKHIVKNNPQYEFIFIFDRAYDKKWLFAKNITAVVKGPRVNSLLVSRYWYDIKVPAVLKKYKADVFVAGNGICSLTAKVPQCLLVSDLSFLYYPSFFKKTDLFFLKRYTKKFLQKAKRVVVLSEFVQKSIVSLNAITKAEIDVVYGAAPDFFRALSETEKDEVKQRYTDGKNYFLYAGPIHPAKNIINLLKAFSVFKKRQKSDWKLVLAGNITPGYKSFTGSIKTYKHRADVTRVEDKNDAIAQLTGSAYAFIYPSFWESSGLPILPAMASAIPVITSVNSAMQEIAGEAALYINPGEYKDIADKMMLLYKDEPLRGNLIEKGKIAAARYDWEKAAALFWQSIVNAIK
jgi:glycosyltransferase involved in cell wall biosynthesis